MKFTPKTDEQIKEESEFALLPEGYYDFIVVKAEDGFSKSSGNPMITLTLKVWDKDGKEHTVWDYLLESMSVKLKSFCDATGISDRYLAGEVNQYDCEGKSGKVWLKVDPAKNGYAAKNTVKSYLADVDKIKKTAEASGEFDDKIPF